MNKKKPIILVAAIILAVVTAISASTFAWFTAQDTVVNRIETAKLVDGAVTIIETFDPDDRLEPGVGITKKVGAINTGDAPALVRISFEEMLQKLAYLGGSPYESGIGIDYQVRDQVDWNNLTASTNAKKATHIPELVDIAAYTGWLTWDLTSPPIPYINTTAEGRMEDLLLSPTATPKAGLGITLRYKQTSATTNPLKYSFAAYRALGTTPETYQRVELRPELFNIIRVPSSVLAEKNDRSKDTFQLDVVLVDPSKGTGDEILQYKGAAKGDGFFYNFISLQLAAKREAKWYITATNGGDIGPTPPASISTGSTLVKPKVVAGTPPVVTAESLDGTKAVTDWINGFIRLIFNSPAVYTGADPSDPGALNKWWYNPVDGFFYYIGVVEPGEATPMLLDEIYLSEVAGKDYAYILYELTVKMDAIQATSAAVVSTEGGGWGEPTSFLNGVVQTPSPVPLPANLIKALQACCAAIEG